MTTIFAKRTHSQAQAFRTTAQIFADITGQQQQHEKTHFEEKEQHGRNHEKKESTNHPQAPPVQTTAAIVTAGMDQTQTEDECDGEEDPQGDPQTFVRHQEEDMTEEQSDEDMLAAMMADDSDDDFIAINVAVQAPTVHVQPPPVREREPIVEREETKSTGDTDCETFEEVHVEVASPVVRRRDVKAEAKGAKQACTGCQVKFWKMADTQMRVCHNCIKIYQAVVDGAMMHGGVVTVAHNKKDRAHFVYECCRQHQWIAPFRAKQGRRWCSHCPAIERQERRDAQQEADDREQERMAREQARIFAQAAEEMFGHQQQQEEEQEVHVITPAMAPADAQFIQMIVERMIAGQHQFDEEDQQRMVDIIMGNAEIDIGQALFDHVAEEHRGRIEKRMAFMMHPDKNAHANAKEAFQKLYRSLLNSKFRWRLSCIKTQILIAILNFAIVMIASAQTIATESVEQRKAVHFAQSAQQIEAAC